MMWEDGALGGEATTIEVRTRLDRLVTALNLPTVPCALLHLVVGRAEVYTSKSGTPSSRRAAFGIPEVVIGG